MSEHYHELNICLWFVGNSVDSFNETYSLIFNVKNILLKLLSKHGLITLKLLKKSCLISHILQFNKYLWFLQNKQIIFPPCINTVYQTLCLGALTLN